MSFRGSRVCPYCGGHRCPNARSKDPLPQDCPEFEYDAWLSVLKEDDDDADPHRE